MIPEIKIQLNLLYTGIMNRTGSMCNAYSPFLNLSDTNKNLGNFTTPLLDFDLSHPVDILTQESYDGSVNLILNDGKNQPRLIGSRFSVVDNKRFKVVDHVGFKDTNIYEEDTFDIDTSLKTIALKIPVVELDKLTEFGGNLPCGTYTFYFKLSDADGNESEIVAESGMVQMFIGGLTGDSSLQSVLPESMRMGVEDESTGKSITFKITNIDSGFDYIHVLYARSSSSNDQAAADTYHKIIYDYPVVNNEAIITITGNEQIIGISAEELYVNYADLLSVNTLVILNNVLFFGNLNKKERDWDLLRRISWKIIPSVGQKLNIGSIDKKYNIGGQSYKDSGCYYNPYNVYYRTGYWADEVYRFGVVYIFKDNSLSPVFNVPGVDFTKIKNISIENLFRKVPVEGGNTYFEYEAEPDDYYFDEACRINSRGVIKFPKISNYIVKGGVLYPSPIYINFDLSHITDYYDLSEGQGQFKTKEDWKLFLDSNDIKGLFFVRQRRIPTILGLGLSIGLTSKDNGACPIIKTSGTYRSQSFLSNRQLILLEGSYISGNKSISVNALLMPDAELREATYNLLFTSNSYALIDLFLVSFSGSDKDLYAYYGNYFMGSTLGRKLTNVPEDIKSLTDGDMYFSTLIGNPSEAYKTSDLINVWDETAPQILTKSTTLLRGLWGAFVGVGKKDDDNSRDLTYGHIYNIKSENYINNEEEATSLDFLKRFNSAETYNAICDRTELTNILLSLDCYRGDCFISFFTHRMFRNFVDPELPTNDKIINPSCWALNYAVRCTAIETAKAEYNVYKEDLGWCIDEPLSKYANEIATAFEVKEKGSSDWAWDPKYLYWWKGGTSDNPEKIANQIGGADYVSDYISNDNLINLIKPSEQETSGIAGAIKNIFKSSRWALRGLTSINRADVNAVGLGLWITFPICSSINIALRDIDYSNATEQAAFNRKRSFYPLSKMDIHNPLRDSNVINLAASISLPHKHYYAMPNVPFIKQEYFTRVINSLRDSAASITNEFKVMLESAYRDYTKIYGSITKLMPLGSKMLIVFEHGLGVLALNDQMMLALDALGYLPAELNMTVSPTYGSMWKDSVIEASGYIYGVDSVAKVIWRVSSECQLELISQMKIEKFLIDNLDMSEFTTKPYVGHINIKSHYNAFKHDIMFTYYNDILYKFDSGEYGDEDNKTPLSDFGIDSDGYLLDSNGLRTEYKGERVSPKYNEVTGKIDSISDLISEGGNFKWATGKSWSICFNELLGKFVTFYDWIPLESENIDNIWFSFDREAANKLAERGFNNNLPLAVKPKPYVKSKKYGRKPPSTQTPNYNTTTPELRDEKYPKHVIDSTFNTSCAINYIKPGKQIAFLDISIAYLDNFANMFGLYLKPGVKYGIKIYDLNNHNITESEQDLTNLDLWLFVAIRITNQNITSVKIIVSVIVKENDLNVTGKGAVTDIIHKQLPDTFESIPDQIIYAVSDENLDSYYSIRDLESSLRLWKHGLAGVYDNERNIRPTHWYGQLHEFNFEFIARQDAMHKIFSNLLIISNKAEPHKFEFEVVGEVYDWHLYKPVLKWIADQIKVPTNYKTGTESYQTLLDLKFIEVLTTSYGLLRKKEGFPIIFGMKPEDYFEKLPYLKVTDACVPTLDPQIIGKKTGEKDKPDIYLTPELQDRGEAHSDNTVDCCLVYDKQLNEFRVHTEQLGNNIWKYGRLRGNMQYLEDLWRVEIRPVAFKWAYLDKNGTITQQSILASNNVSIHIDPNTGYIRTISGNNYNLLSSFTLLVPAGRVANVIPKLVGANQTATIIQICNGVRVPTQIQNGTAFDIGGRLYFTNRTSEEITIEFDPRDVLLFNFWSDDEGGKPLNEPGLIQSRIVETRHRDKYIKVKVRYTGEDLAVILAILTIFDYSYA